MLTRISQTHYARAFFVVSPEEAPLTPGETRFFPMHYERGNPSAKSFRMLWFANRSDADARINPLTDIERLPVALFNPTVPDKLAKSDILQNGNVRLTSPQSGGYENPVGVIDIVQDTESIEPRIYLVEDEITIPRLEPYIDYMYRYAIGHPPITEFHVEWYPTRLDAKLRLNMLTDTTRLPRVEFFPSVPNWNSEPETLQEGVLRVFCPDGQNPYSLAFGLLCVNQILCDIDDIAKRIPSPRKSVRDSVRLNKSVKEIKSLRQIPKASGVGIQKPVLNCEFLQYAAGDTIDINLGELANGFVKGVNIPDFLRTDGTHLKGIMPDGELHEMFEITLEAQSSTIITSTLYLKRGN